MRLRVYTSSMVPGFVLINSDWKLSGGVVFRQIKDLNGRTVKYERYGPTNLGWRCKEISEKEFKAALQTSRTW